MFADPGKPTVDFYSSFTLVASEVETLHGQFKRSLLYQQVEVRLDILRNAQRFVRYYFPSDNARNCTGAS